jgi:hypothetical protein
MAGTCDQIRRDWIIFSVASDIRHAVAGGPAGFEVDFRIELGTQLADFKRLGRGADVDGGGGLKRWGGRAG